MELLHLILCVEISAIVLQLDGTEPLYQQVYRAFRSEILSRTLVPANRFLQPVPSLTF